MAPLRTLIPALGLWLLQAGHAHARAQGFTGAEHPFKREPKWDAYFSFGQEHPIPFDGHTIQNFEVLGNPEVLSDRVILTPPYPGNQRAALWSIHSNHHQEWEAHVPFRASGPERAGGSLQIWYTHRGASATGTSTVYSAKPFEGLVIVIDSQGGRGSIRGYLNDGSTDYSAHHHPTSLAFGNCDAAYRNLGRPSDLKIQHSIDHGLIVEIDNHICFQTNKVSLPDNYRFGISAASSENNPDSFEVFGFKLANLREQDEEHHEPEKKKEEKKKEEKKKAKKNNKKKEEHQDEDHHEEIQKRHKEAAEKHASMADSKFKDFKSKYELSDEDAAHFKDQSSQFSDLHLRMQALTHQIAEVQRATGEISYTVGHLVEVINDFSGVSEHDKSFGVNMKDIDSRLHNIDMTIKNLEKSLRHEGDKITLLNDHHDNLHHHIKEAVVTHGPNMGFMVSIVIVVQIMLAIAYVFYKRRRTMAPKKYL